MRIAVVAGEYPTPRAPQKAMFVRDQVEALRAQGHEVAVIHHEPPTLRRLANAIRRRRPSPTGPTPAASTPPTASAATASRLRTLGRVAHDRAGQTIAARAIRRDLHALTPPPQVIHAHNVFPAACAAARVAARNGIPLVITEHSSAFQRHQLSASELRLAAATYAGAAAVIAVSPRQAEALPATGVLTVPNIVPSDFAPRRPGAARDGDIVSIGTLMAHKGMDVLIHAYAELPPAVRQRHRLVIVGDGPDAPRLAALARTLDVAERVTFTGHLPRARVAEVLCNAAVLVSASPVETFGVTLLEGLAAGVPFVAVRSGGPESIWFPGAGVLVSASTPADLAAGLRQAIDTDTDGVSDADRRCVVQRRFGASTVAARLTEIYREAVAATGPRKAR